MTIKAFTENFHKKDSSERIDHDNDHIKPEILFKTTLKSKY